MTRFDLPAHVDIAASILEAPGWARVGLTMPDRAMREKSAQELARVIVERLMSLPTADSDQLPLPL